MNGIRIGALAVALLAGLLPGPAPARAAKPSPSPTTRAAAKDEPPTGLARILDGAPPKSLADLRAMEAQFRRVAAKVTPATVGINSRGGGGSGVIISKDGYVLTVGHVVREAGRDVTVLLPDGRRARAKTLGADLGVDSGLVKIVEKPKGDAGWPHCEMGNSDALKRGQWCLAAGHPGGFRRGRTPPIRVGRILRSTPTVILSDCTIVSGDSGGPLFDMDGKVVGISSRISGPLDGNIHVPVDAFRREWARLLKGDVFGSRGQRPGGPYLGVVADPASDKALIQRVMPGSAADRAGIRPGDMITEFDGKAVDNWQKLVELIARKKPGDRARITVLRERKTVKLQAVLGRRGS